MTRTPSSATHRSVVPSAGGNGADLARFAAGLARFAAGRARLSRLTGDADRLFRALHPAHAMSARQLRLDLTGPAELWPARACMILHSMRCS